MARIAVVGSGPSAFFLMEALWRHAPDLRINVFERLPAPFGLVRGGVAPDSQKIKQVTQVFDGLAHHPGFRFWGNVTIGRDITIAELSRSHDAVVLATGASRSRKLGIPGEDLPGSWTASDFVGWYNGDPGHAHSRPDFSHPVAVVVGQGNVALDISRILGRTPDELRDTDMPEHVLAAFAESRIKEIHCIGRRGPAQAAFTLPELKELGALADCAPVVDPAALALDPISQAELDDPANKHAQRNLEVLRRYALPSGKPATRRIHIRFLLSPVALEGQGRVEELTCMRNRLIGEPFNTFTHATDAFETIPCGLCISGAGFQGEPMVGLPFDPERGVIPNTAGRTPVPGVYTAGWIKRGPKGIIGNAKPDSLETARAILEDLPVLSPPPEPSDDFLLALTRERGVRVVSYADWERIDAAERARGAALGKPREKLTSVDAMLAVITDP